jgi:membrane associated rhomboid family serine protease
LNYAAKKTKGLGVSIAALPLFLALAVWQFYLFVTFRGANGTLESHGGYIHLVIAICVALLACITGFFVFSVFLRRDREDELHITSLR